MDEVASSLGGGVAATAVLTGYLLAVDALVTTYDVAVFGVIRDLLSVGETLSYLVYAVLFVVAWPLLFAALTAYLPGEAGAVHGALFGAAVWLGYLAGVALPVVTVEAGPVGFPFLVVTLAGFVVFYGFVLGGVYDALADHRTFEV